MGQEAIHWCITVCLAISSHFIGMLLVSCLFIHAEETQLIKSAWVEIFYVHNPWRPTSKQNSYAIQYAI
jgi:hypothetical protein